MRGRTTLFAVSALALPLTALAHVSVAPRISKPGAEEQYTVRVPTEKGVATTTVELDVPEGVTVTEVTAAEGAKHEETRTGSRVAMIIWTKEIPPQQRAEFVFTAKNPATAGEVTWRVRQRYADGTSSDWSPVTKLAAAPAPPANDASAVENWLKGYDSAFNAKDLDKLAAFYHPDVTIFEGGGVNNGWIDYRDRHLGPELKEMQNPQLSHTNVKVTLLGDGRGAYVTSSYGLKAKMGERDVDSGGLETLVLVKQADGAWKIRHSHTSARPRRPAGQ